MSIPYWRNKEYTDDGCTIYQCLNCYAEWESRTAPWWSIDGVKPAGKKIWNCCPICKCEWKGEKLIKKEKKYFPFYPHDKTNRLFPLEFSVISVYKDDQYISNDVRSQNIKDPLYALKIKRDYEKSEQCKNFTYRIVNLTKEKGVIK